MVFFRKNNPKYTTDQLYAEKNTLVLLSTSNICTREAINYVGDNLKYLDFRDKMLLDKDSKPGRNSI